MEFTVHFVGDAYTSYSGTHTFERGGVLVVEPDGGSTVVFSPTHWQTIEIHGANIRDRTDENRAKISALEGRTAGQTR